MVHVDIQAVDELAADVGQFKDIDAVDAAGFVEKDHRSGPAQAQAR